LVMHEFSSALVGSINTFILHRYFIRCMLLVATPLNGWLLQLNKFQEHGDHGHCVHKHHSISDVVFIVILSTFFDDNGGAGSTHKILLNCNWVLLKDCWTWWLVLVADDSVDDYPKESRLPSKHAGFRQQKTQLDSLLSLFV